MKYLQREVARRANKSANRINHFFGGRYKWTIVNEERYYWNSIKYIFQNPTRAGICSKVEEYLFSSLNNRAFDWEMVDWFSPFKRPVELDLDWLNSTFATEVEIAIGKALRRREFKIPTNKGKRIVNLDATPYEKGTVT